MMHKWRPDLMSALRSSLIDKFIEDQKRTHDYLLLTLDGACRTKHLPTIVTRSSMLVVSEYWQFLTSRDLAQIEHDLMTAAAMGAFTKLWWMQPISTVELLPHFERAAVEAEAARIVSKIEFRRWSTARSKMDNRPEKIRKVKSFDPWKVTSEEARKEAIAQNDPGRAPENTAERTPDNLAELLSHGDNIEGLWVHRADVVEFFTKRGVAVPECWQSSDAAIAAGAPASADRIKSGNKTTKKPKIVPTHQFDTPEMEVVRLALVKVYGAGVEIVASIKIITGNITEQYKILSKERGGKAFAPSASSVNRVLTGGHDK